MDNTKVKEIKKPLHFGSKYSNQILEWMSPDSKEVFDQSMQDPVRRALLENAGWDKPGSITYKFNSHGFRCDEFDNSPCIMALGCSFTIGIGLPIEYTWPYLVGQQLNLKVVNLGWGGYSADSCFRLAEYWIPKLRPSYVVMLTPSSDRFELLLDPSTNHNSVPVEIFLPNSESSLFSMRETLLKHWFINSENGEINQRKNKLALEKLCDNYNIPCSIFDANSNTYWGSKDEFARDFMHAGPTMHRNIAKKVVDGYRYSTS